MTFPLRTIASSHALGAWFGVALASLPEDIVLLDSHRVWPLSSERRQPARPVRDQSSSTCTGAIENAAAFGPRICHKAWQCGVKSAECLWSLSQMYSRVSIESIALCRARHHLREVVLQLFPLDRQHSCRWVLRRNRELDGGGILSSAKALVARAGAYRP